jgi:hypothetical protein
MTYTRTAKATAAAAEARSRAAVERKLREAATLLHLHGWYLASPDYSLTVRLAVTRDNPLAGRVRTSPEWRPGDDVR